MSERVIGVAAMGGSGTQVLETVHDLERRGVPAAWLTTGGAGLDGITLLAAAGVQLLTVHQDFIVQMGRRAAPGAADQPDLLTKLQSLSAFDE